MKDSKSKTEVITVKSDTPGRSTGTSTAENNHFLLCPSYSRNRDGSLSGKVETGSRRRIGKHESTSSKDEFRNCALNEKMREDDDQILEMGVSAPNHHRLDGGCVREYRSRTDNRESSIDSPRNILRGTSSEAILGNKAGSISPPHLTAESSLESVEDPVLLTKGVDWGKSKGGEEATIREESGSVSRSGLSFVTNVRKRGVTRVENSKSKLLTCSESSTANATTKTLTKESSLAGAVDDQEVGDVGDVSEYDGVCAPPLEASEASEADIDDEDEEVVCVSSTFQSPRSKSVDRKLNEAARFAEAVGEAPPTDEDDLRVIIEENCAYSSSEEDEDDDDDEGEENDEQDECETSLAIDDLETCTSLASPSRRQPHSALQEQAKGVASVQLSLIPPQGQMNGVASVQLSPVAPKPLLDVVSCRTHEGRVINEQHPQSSQVSSVTQSASLGVEVSKISHSFSANVVADSPVKRRAVITNDDTNEDSTSLSSTKPMHFMSHIKDTLSGCFAHYTPSREPAFIYRGIMSNPPEITKRGLNRGNYAQLHRKAWLEVSDRHHRYGKNLRAYYKHWESLGHPTNMFFDWLDSEGEAANCPLPELPEFPRSELDSDTVLYINDPEVQARYEISFEMIPSSNTQESISPRLVHRDGQPVVTGPDGFIFVLRDHKLYAAQKVTRQKCAKTSGDTDGKPSSPKPQRFHHSSFFGGKAVAAAGIIVTDEFGQLTRLYPHSGHYRPGEAHMQRMLFFLQKKGVDLNTFEVDTQQILHVSRQVKDTTPKGGTKVDTAEGDKDIPGARTPQTGKDGIDSCSGINPSSNLSTISAPSKSTATTTTTTTSKKAKKIMSLHLRPAMYVACFLGHKARMIGEGVFAQLHHIRKCEIDEVSGGLVSGVVAALGAVDNGVLTGRRRWIEMNQLHQMECG